MQLAKVENRIEDASHQMAQRISTATRRIVLVIGYCEIHKGNIKPFQKESERMR